MIVLHHPNIFVIGLILTSQNVELVCPERKGVILINQKHVKIVNMFLNTNVIEQINIILIVKNVIEMNKDVILIERKHAILVYPHLNIFVIRKILRILCADNALRMKKDVISKRI